MNFCQILRFWSASDNIYKNRLSSLDLCKINKNSEHLLELRSQCIEAQKKSQDTGGEVGANESDDTTATELDTDDQSTLKGEIFWQLYGNFEVKEEIGLRECS